MQVRPQKPNKKKVLTIIIIILLLAGGVFAFVYATRPLETDNSSDTSETTNTDNSSNTNDSPGTSTDAPDSNSTNNTPTKVQDKTPVQYEGGQVDDEPTTNNEQFRIPEGE